MPQLECHALLIAVGFHQFSRITSTITGRRQVILHFKTHGLRRSVCIVLLSRELPGNYQYPIGLSQQRRVLSRAQSLPIANRAIQAKYRSKNADIAIVAIRDHRNGLKCGRYPTTIIAIERYMNSGSQFSFGTKKAQVALIRTPATPTTRHATVHAAEPDFASFVSSNCCPSVPVSIMSINVARNTKRDNGRDNPSRSK